MEGLFFPNTINMKLSTPKRPGKLLWILPLQLLFLVTTAQNTRPTVSGIVKNEDGMILNGAVVEAQDAGNTKITSVTTDEKGLFQIFRLPAGGPYHFIFSHVGYATDTLRGYMINDKTRLEDRKSVV